MPNNTSNNKIGFGGDMDYLQFLVDHYGGDTDVETVWRGEQKRLTGISTLPLQRKALQEVGSTENDPGDK